MTTITVLNAGLRNPSSTKLLADQIAAALRAGQPHDLDLSIIDLRNHAHAITDALLTGFPTGELVEVLHQVTHSDALVVVTPVFQASYSGLFKSFIDLIEPGTLRDVPVLLAATGGSERHSLVLDHALRPLFSYLGADPINTGVYAATSDFGPGAVELGHRVDRAAAQLLARVSPRSQRAIGGGERRREITDTATDTSDFPTPVASSTAQASGGGGLPDGVVPFAEMLSRYAK